MKIYCINLDRFMARFERLQRLLEGSDVELIRIAALDGNRLRERPIPPKRRPGALDGKGMVLTRFEIGAVLSHRKAWRAFLRTTDTHALFIEDDVYFGANFAAYIKSNVFENTDYDIINIETTNAPVIVRNGIKLPLDDRHLFELKTYQAGAGGYILNRPTAEKLLIMSAGATEGIDTIAFNMARQNESGIKPFKQAQVSPALIVQHVCHPTPPYEPLLESYIADRRGPRIIRTPMSVSKLFKEITRPIRKFWFNLNHKYIPFS